MQAELFEATINHYCGQKPFKPFTVVLVNGNQIEVDYPTAILVRSGKAVYMGPSSVISVFDHHGVARIVDDLIEQSANESAA